MKLSAYKQILPLLFLFVGFCAAPNGTIAAKDSPTITREFEKEINKSFSLDGNGLLELANRHGQINVVSWSKDQVDIKVRIVVQASDQGQADKVFERIRIDFNESLNNISAITRIGTSDKSWWDKLTGGWGGSSNDFKIVYDVKMPSKAYLKANAMYCNISCDDHLGETDIYAKYGNVSLGELGDDSRVEVGYGNANVEAFNGRASIRVGYGNLDIDKATQELEVNIRYGDLRIDQAGELLLDSRYTDCRLGKINQLRLNGSYGDVEIDEVHELRASTTYLGYDIDKVWKSFDISTGYGDVEVGWLGPDFTEARFKGSYADIEIRVDPAAGYEVDARTSYADVDLPSSVELSRRESKSNSVSMQGRKSGKGNGRMSLSSSYGDIEVRE